MGRRSAAENQKKVTENVEEEIKSREWSENCPRRDTINMHTAQLAANASFKVNKCHF